MRHERSRIRLLAGWFSLLTALSAQSLLTFESAELSGATSALDPDWVLTGLVASAVSRGGGISAASLSGAFASSGFNTGSENALADARQTGDFLELSLAPAAGYAVSLTSLDVNLRRTSTGPSSFEWQYSFDSFVTGGTTVAAFTYAGTETQGLAQATVDLTSAADLQEVGFGRTITFRLYAAGASTAAGSLAIGRLNGADLTLGGSLSAVPEPGTYACWGGGAVLALAAWRRWRTGRADPPGEAGRSG